MTADTGEGIIQERIVQLLNPKTRRYIKVDRLKATIVGRKRTQGPYKNVPVVPGYFVFKLTHEEPKSNG